MNRKYQALLSILGEKARFGEPLYKYTSFKIGGPADIFFKAGSVEELVRAYRTAVREEIPVFILGGGTNLLVSDRGFPGLVIKNEINEMKICAVRGIKKAVEIKNSGIHTAFVEVGSGVMINRLVRFTLDQSLSGLEFFLGQPGTVGGAVYINAHNVHKKAYLGDFIHNAKILTKDGRLKVVSKGYFRFGYDKSVIQKTGDIVLSAIFKLSAGKKKRLWQIAQSELSYRQKTQPYGLFTSGCTFRNIEKSDAIRLSTPNFTCSVGYLLDKAGLKGKSVGGARFSVDHANFIINENNAKASDVLKLIRLAKGKVKQMFKVNLKEEIVYIGDFSYA